LLITINKASSIKLADLREMSLKASKSDCTCTTVVSPDPLPPLHILVNKEEEPDDPEPADKKRYANRILL
jgi:hypothetical protein